MVDHRRLLLVLVEFAHTLIREYDAEAVLEDLCARVSEILPVAGAGVMLEGDDGHLRFAAASDATLAKIEELQIASGEGPCIRAHKSGEQVVIADLTLDATMPEFARRALQVGIHAVYSFPMRIDGRKLGALNLYHKQPCDFDDDDREAAQALADIATVYLLGARKVERTSRVAEQLQQALDSRVIIEQAKGVLVAQLGVDVDEAFRILRTHARNHGASLRDVAGQVVAGDLSLHG